MENKVKKLTVLESFEDVRSKLLQEVDNLYLCTFFTYGVSRLGYPPASQVRLDEELSNIDDDLWRKCIYTRNSREKKVRLNHPFWEGKDLKNRIEFLDRVITKLKNEKKDAI